MSIFPFIILLTVRVTHLSGPILSRRAATLQHRAQSLQVILYRHPARAKSVRCALADVEVAGVRTAPTSCCYTSSERSCS